MPENNQLQPTSVPADPWAGLKRFTNARIALGRTGNAIPLREVLAFRLAHANARDAVHSQLEVEKLSAALCSLNLPFLLVQSMAPDRKTYLKRSDLGRKLHATGTALLQMENATPADVSITIADGLSATAVNQHALALLQHLLPILANNKFSVAPICLATQARVAIADEIGAWQQARLSLILIGERPGLGTADSMGAYLTFAPRAGLTDDSRNCISNIRPAGLNIPLAAEKIGYFIQASLRLQLSGVALKDESNLLGG